jgi:RHS repeat-associated protein
LSAKYLDGASQSSTQGQGEISYNTEPFKYRRERGCTYYELSNHLGNVLVTVTDMKIGISTDGDDFAEYYEATVVSAVDYYPFGSAMAGRKFNDNSYRYGFNGQEEDPEWKGGAVVFKYRIHDTRIGKFLSVDPLASEYPWNSTYAFAENDVIRAIDLEGAEKLIVTFKGDGAMHMFNKILVFGLEGQFKPTLQRIGESNRYEVYLIPTTNGGDVSLMSKQGQEFYKKMSKYIKEGEKTTLRVVSSSADIGVDSYQQEAVDMTDVLFFKETNPFSEHTGFSQIGKIVHVIEEQKYAEEFDPGRTMEPTGYDEAHKRAMKAENDVNGNTRKFKPVRAAGDPKGWYTTVLQEANGTFTRVKYLVTIRKDVLAVKQPESKRTKESSYHKHRLEMYDILKEVSGGLTFWEHADYYITEQLYELWKEAEKKED